MSLFPGPEGFPPDRFLSVEEVNYLDQEHNIVREENVQVRTKALLDRTVEKGDGGRCS